MASDLGELVYTLTLNDSGFESKLNSAKDQVKESSDQIATSNEQIESSSEKAGGAFSGMAGQFVIGTAIFTLGQKALDAVKGAVDGAIQSAKDWQTAQAGMNAELKSTHDASGETSKKLVDLAEGIQNTTPISREATLTGENMLLTFTNIGKNVFPQTTQAMVDMATRMNGGLVPSAQQLNTTAIELGKALNDPTTGMTKLQKVGVTFSDQQKEQIKTMQKAGDTVGAQTVILNELSKEFGGSASANMKTYQGQVDALKNKFNDLAGQAIQKLLAMLEKVGVFLLQHKALLVTVAGAVGGLAIAIGVALVAALWAAVAPAIIAVAAMWPIIAVGAAIGLLAYEIITHWNTLKKWWGDLKTFISQIGQDIINAWKSVVTWFDNFWDGIKRGFNELINFLKPVGIVLLAIILLPLLPAAILWKHFHKEIMDGFKAVADFIMSDFIKPVSKFINDFVKWLGDIWTDSFNFAKGLWNDFTHFVSGIMKNITDAIKAPLSGFGTMLYNAGKDLINGLIKGIGDMAGKAGDAIKSVGKGIVSVAKDVLKQFSPSKVFQDIGQNVSLGLAGGITQGSDTAIQATRQMTQSVITAGATMPSTINNQTSSSIGGNNYSFAGANFNFHTAAAVDEFFNISNRNITLESNGIAPLAGTTGI